MPRIDRNRKPEELLHRILLTTFGHAVSEAVHPGPYGEEAWQDAAVEAFEVAATLLEQLQTE